MHLRVLAAVLAAAVLPSVASADDYYLRTAVGHVEPSGGELETDQTWNLGLGWRFNRFLSVEGAYNDLGQYSLPGIGGPVAANVSSWEVGMAAKIPFGNSGVFGQIRAGAHRWKSELSSFAVLSQSAGTDPYYGLGLGYDFNDKVGMTVSYERYDWDIADVDRLMIGIEVR